MPRNDRRMSTWIGLEYVVLRCVDLERSRIFYEALGLDLVSEQHGTGARHYACTLGDVVVELYPTSLKQTSSVRLGLRVSNIGDAMDALKKIGADILRVDAGGSFAVVRDPDGHEIALRSASTADAT